MDIIGDLTMGEKFVGISPWVPDEISKANGLFTRYQLVKRFPKAIEQ